MLDLRRLLLCLTAVALAVPLGTTTAAATTTTQTRSCTDGGGVRWTAKARWGASYEAAGVRMASVSYGGWTTSRAGTVPTDARVRTYDGAGHLVRSLDWTGGFAYRAGAAYRSVNPRNPVSAPGKARVTITLGVDGDGFGNCTVAFVQPPEGAAPAFSLTPVDGGTDYYARFRSNTLPTDPSYFPRGVWMEQGPNAGRLAGYGINLIVNPVAGNSTHPAVRNLATLKDEADMWAGPGDDEWSGRYPGEGAVCRPATGRCGYTVMRQSNAAVPAGSMRYANYGKGVGYWETDAEASRFVNEFQDVTSVDLYWGTDANICGAWEGAGLLGSPGKQLAEADCRKPANYGRAVDRVRSLVQPARSKPVYGFVELGHPGTNGLTMPLAKIRPAVWSALIHEARGIVYFNHSFGGPCQSQHVLDDCDPAIARTVTAVNAEIQALAPVLNAPRINGVTKTGDIDVLAKYDGHDVWVLTGSNRASGATSGSVTVPLVGDGTAEVVGEGRTVPVQAGRIDDRWPDSMAVHVYRIR